MSFKAEVEQDLNETGYKSAHYGTSGNDTRREAKQSIGNIRMLQMQFYNDNKNFHESRGEIEKSIYFTKSVRKDKSYDILSEQDRKSMHRVFDD